jgi:hypothetical protein
VGIYVEKIKIPKLKMKPHNVIIATFFNFFELRSRSKVLNTLKTPYERSIAIAHSNKFTFPIFIKLL